MNKNRSLPPAALLRRITEKLYFHVRRLTGVSSKTLLRHAAACRALNTDYVWGGLGERITPQLVEHKRAQYPDQYDEPTCQRLLARCAHEVYGFDCCGLIKTCLMGGLAHFRYDPALDLNAAMLLEKAPAKGPIETLPERPGLCLYMEGHVGIYTGNGRVTEATPSEQFGYGVVETGLSDRPWLYWFECPTVRYR